MFFNFVQQNLMLTFGALGLATTALALFPSKRRTRTALAIAGWCLGCGTVGAWLGWSLSRTGDISWILTAVWAEIGIIAGSIGQLKRSYVREKMAAASPPRQTPVAATTRPARQISAPVPWRRWLQTATPALLAAALIILAVIGILHLRRGPVEPPVVESPLIEPPSPYPSVKDTWKYHTGLPWKGNADSFHTPALGDDGTVYVLGGDSVLAFTPAGELKWRYAPHDMQPQTSLLVAQDGAIWTGSLYGWITRISSDGEGQPQFGGAGASNQLALSPSGELLLCGRSMSNRFDTTGYPRDVRDYKIGKLDPLRSAAFAASGAITIEQDRLTSWPADFQQPVWQRKVGWGCHHPAIAADGSIYLACFDSLTAVNEDGSDKWSFPIKVPSPPVITNDGAVIFGAIDGDVYKFDAAGNLVWKSALGKAIVSTPAVSHSGVIYVGSQANRLFALDPQGNVLWTLKAYGEVLSPTTGPDGTVYVQSSDGVLHAVAQPENGTLDGQWPKLDADLHNTARVPD